MTDSIPNVNNLGTTAYERLHAEIARAEDIIKRGDFATKTDIANVNSSLKEKAKQSYVDSKVEEINSSIEEIATKGTTVDVIEQATKEEIERQIEDGTIANLTIEDYSIDYKKDKFLSGNIATSNKNFLEINFKTGKITVNTLVLVTIKDVKWQLDACEVDLDKYANNTWIIVYKTPNNTADADSRVLLDCDINSMPNGAVILFKILKDTRGYYHLVENTSITNGTLIDNDGTKRILSILQINDFVEDAIKTDFKNANILTKNQTALVENKAISDLRFRLKAIKNNRNMELLNFEEKFESEDCIFDLFDRVNGGYLSAEEDISANIVDHRFVFKNLKDTEDETCCFYKASCCKADLTSKQFTIEVTKNEGIIYIGVLKDADNYFMFKYDITQDKCDCEIIHENGGIALREANSTRTRYMKLEAPYRLIVMLNNRVIYLIGEKDGIYYTLSIIEPMKINDTTVASDRKYDTFLNENWYFGFGARFKANTMNNSVEINKITSSYGSGLSVGADFKPIRYKNGEAICKDDCIFITASSHTTQELHGLAGINIYKLNLRNYKLDFVGKVLSQHPDTSYIIGDGSATILYDNDNKEYIVSTSCFGLEYSDTRIWVGKTKSDLLTGINIVQMQQMVGSFNESPAWDCDFIYDEVNNEWKGALLHGKLIKASDVLGTWSEYGTCGGFEGQAITRCCNRNIVTSVHNLEDGGYESSLYAHDLDTGEEICKLNFDKFPKNTDVSKYSFSTPVWGSIIPMYDGYRTKYYAVLFSIRTWENKRYSYGDMWIYEAIETNVGNEYF